MICVVCEDVDWVCECGSGKPWGEMSDSENACNCGGAGMPCPACNAGNPPRWGAGDVIWSIFSDGKPLN